MKYSLDKIAKELGISKSTVSLILNGHAAERRISAELEKTVKDFCDKVGYVPNINAKRASSKYVKNVGFLINQNLLSTGHNPFSDQNTSEITGGIVSAATNEGFRVTIQFCNEDTDESEILEWLRNREIDGLIYYAYSFDESWYGEFNSRYFLYEKDGDLIKITVKEQISEEEIQYYLSLLEFKIG